MVLMGKKLTAAQALEGTFSSEGLVAMAGEDATVEIALARSLVNRLDEGDVRRLWGKVVNPREQPHPGSRPASPGPVVELWDWLEADVSVPMAVPVLALPAKGMSSRRVRDRGQRLLFEM